MNIISFLNKYKRTVIIVLSLLFVIIMIFPLASVKPEGISSNQSKLSLFNVSSKINSVKDTLGIDTVDIKGIDKNNPKDDIEKTTLALNNVLKNINFAILLAWLSFLAVIIGAMAVYAKPNSKFGLIVFTFSLLATIFSSLLAVSGINILNNNIEDFKSYFGLNKSLLGLTFEYSITLAIRGAILLIIIYALIALRKPCEEKNESEKLTKAILFICAAASVLSVFFITLFLLRKGIPTIAKIGFFDFVFTSKWDPVGETPKFGIANLILTSFAGTFGAVVIGVPVGILVAVFISQLAPQKIGSVLLAVINLLAGIPSVIYGAVGAILLVPFVQRTFHLETGATLFSAIVVLAVMVLPTIISVTTTSLNAVPKTYLEASLALGLTTEASAFKIMIPAARSGIMTGVLLGLGRAIGEAMAIILVAGNMPDIPQIFKPARFLTTGIVAEMGYATGLHRDALFAIGLVLFFFILVINSFFRYFIKKVGKKYE